MAPATKIICTIGPASDSETVLRGMMRAGMDVVRLNCSHAGRREIAASIARVRALNRKYRRRIRVLLDLEGPRIRIGKLDGGGPIPLKKMQVLWLRKGKYAGGGRSVPLDYEGPLTDLRGAEHIFIDDGNISLKVEAVEAERVRTRVVTGGILRERKGLNAPGARLSIPDVSEKDLADIRLGVSEEVDMIAQSFVRSAGAIGRIRGELEVLGAACAVVAKIENAEGLRNLDGIIRASDGVMVARGDLGVSLPIWRIPIIQKEIIARCRRFRRFSITATQMLESMVENRRPTRAEVSDVANAILDGTDYVMLSAETAAGRHPAETVRMMNEIIKYTEQSEYYRKRK
ncbi:MAG: pyruvate kinase [bacterium]|nr:pyruvate kinase [bacterium]